jgi:hypothetical protein
LEFQSYLDSFSTNEEIVGTRLSERIAAIKRQISKRERTVLHSLLEIANDDKVRTLNSEQQADYLRQVTNSKLGRRLAKIASKNESGLDFETTIKKEVEKMKENLSEIIDEKDEDLLCFYSQCSTKDSIVETIRELSGNLLEEMGAIDLLQLIGVTGIAYGTFSGTGEGHQFGDFPDPWLYKVPKLFYGCYLSQTSLQASYVQGKGESLKVPGRHGEIIIGVIPLVSNQKVFNFLKKYAPQLLELQAGISMRRVLAFVPETSISLIASATWRNLHDLVSVENNPEKSIQLETFLKLRTTLYIHHRTGSMKEHTNDLLRENPFPFFTGDRNISSIIKSIVPLLTNIDPKTLSSEKYAKILRAITSFEAYHSLRKRIHYQFREHTSAEIPTLESEWRRNQLLQLLGIDFDRKGLSVGETLSKDLENPKHCEDYALNEKIVEKNSFIFKETLGLLSLVPLIWSNLDNQTELAKIKEPSDQVIQERFGLKCSLFKYKLLVLTESLLSHEQSCRIKIDPQDTLVRSFLFPDATTDEEVDKFLRGVTQNFYKKDYEERLQQKNAKAFKVMSDKLVSSLVSSETIQEFEELLKNGLTYAEGSKKVQISDRSELAFLDLENRLQSEQLQVPERVKKMWYIVLGKNLSGEDVWCNGNSMRGSSLENYKKYFINFGQQELWDKLCTYKKSTHTYRDSSNRHGHGNEKPSYWALGFETLVDYRLYLSEKDWEDYKTIHHSCCGIKIKQKHS